MISSTLIETGGIVRSLEKGIMLSRLEGQDETIILFYYTFWG